MSDTRDERVARLEARLENGFQKIGKALAAGVDVDNWERHFAALLKEYEGLEDILREERQRESPVQADLGLGVREVRDVA